MIEFNSVDAYEKSFQEGYDLRYPDGDVIRTWGFFFKHQFKNIMDKHPKLLDFGCGTGAHCEFYQSKGFDVYGVDVSKTAIKKAKSYLPKYAEHYKVISHGQDIDKVFNTKFDFIHSHQVLYYLSNTDLEKTLNQLNSILNEDGYVYLTMVSTKCYMYNENAETHDGLKKVILTGRVESIEWVNFVESEEEMKKKFDIFETISTGYYDIKLPEGSSLHYYFIGKKRN